MKCIPKLFVIPFLLLFLFGNGKYLNAQQKGTLPCDSIIAYIPNVLIRTCESSNDQDCAIKPTFFCGDPVDYEMTIYDRWGTIIFETKDFKYGWEGKDEKTGNRVGDGVYVWKIKCTFKQGEKEHEYSGKVTAIS